MHPKVVNYTLTVIEQLAEQQAGYFECIFLDINVQPPDDNGFLDILTSPRLDHIAKYVINDSFVMSAYSGLPRSPALMVVNVHAEEFQIQIDQFAINPNTRIIVLFEVKYAENLFFFIFHFFKHTAFTQIACIESSEMVFIQVGHNGLFTGYPDYLEPSELFSNVLRNMNGREITYSDGSSPTYSDIMWMNATAEYLNATAKFIKSPCHFSVGWMSDCYMEFMGSQKITITLDGTFYCGLDKDMYRILFDVVPDVNVFVVPTPRCLNVLEMFYGPYSLPVWIILGLIVVSLELLNVCVPNLFRNDPILLIVCGFERYDLHRANAIERLIFISMIIFFFLMTNAFETRIISYMIDKPTIGRIETVEQLIDSGLPLAASKLLKPGIFNDTKFSATMVDITNESDLAFDRERAYYGNGYLMKERIRMPMNYDFEKRRPSHYILDRTDGMVVYAYWLPRQDALLELFYFTRRAVFEAGLLQNWNQIYFSGYLAVLEYAYPVDNSIDITLDFGDLFPSWIALSAGYCLSLIIFAVEMLTAIVTREMKTQR